MSTPMIGSALRQLSAMRVPLIPCAHMATLKAAALTPSQWSNVSPASVEPHLQHARLEGDLDAAAGQHQGALRHRYVSGRPQFTIDLRGERETMSKLGQIFTAGVSNDIAVLIDDVANSGILD